VSGATCTAGLIGDFWSESLGMLSCTEQEASTLLLVAPHFGGSFKQWTAFTAVMMASIRLFRCDDFLKCIVFHPEYTRELVEVSSAYYWYNLRSPV
jgi:hypothetical protein